MGDDAAWAALFERPIGALIDDCLDDDAVRGVALTDALIGTFAGAHDVDLRQNRCFLYHVIGNGTGHWDVPMGGMGAVTAELEAAARGAGAQLRCGAEVTAIESGPEGVAVRFADAGGGEHVAGAGHVLGNVAPAVLERLRGRAASEAPPEGAQLKVNLLLARLPRLRDGAVDPADAFAGTFHVNEGYAQLERARAQAASGTLPELVPCEIYCHSLTDPSDPRPRAAGRGRADPHVLRAAPAHAAVRRRPRRRARARAGRHAGVAGQRARRALLDCLWRDADGRPCVEARSPLDLEAELGLPGGNIFHRDLAWPFAETEAEVGTWGVETDDPRVLVCGAGARRGGGVSGVPGRNAAMAAVLAGRALASRASDRRARRRSSRPSSRTPSRCGSWGRWCGSSSTGR